MRFSISVTREEKLLLEKYGAHLEGRALGNWVRMTALSAAVDNLRDRQNTKRRATVADAYCDANPFIAAELDRLSG